MVSQGGYFVAQRKG